MWYPGVKPHDFEYDTFVRRAAFENPKSVIRALGAFRMSIKIFSYRVHVSLQKKTIEKNRMPYRFDVTVNKIQLVQVFDTVSYLK